MNDSFELHKKNQFLQQPSKHWDLFYKRNSNNFFKDRHWTTREFPELLKDHTFLLEIGCGHGSFVFPLLESTNLFIYAVDFSPKAVELVKSHPDYDTDRMMAHVMDISDKTTFPLLPPVDLVSCIFILSALPPDNLLKSVQNIFDLMTDGGILLFRDYAIGDLAQKRFKSTAEISPGCYYRHDGTLSYFFSLSSFTELFSSVGFEILEAEYVKKDVVNRKEDLTMARVFLQAKLQKKTRL
jgi:methyltransferase-like protein 6